MNIGIITYHRAENYGSVLQAYALNKYIKNINSKFHVETIDYYNETQEKMYNLFSIKFFNNEHYTQYSYIIEYKSFEKQKESI